MKTAVVGWNSFREYVKTEGRGWLEGVWFEQMGKSVKICENRRGWLEGVWFEQIGKSVKIYENRRGRLEQNSKIFENDRCGSNR